MKKRSVKEGRCMGSGRSVGRRKADRSSAEEKRTDRRLGKAGGASAGEKAEHSTKYPSAGTGGGSEKSRRMFPAAFQHFRTAGGTPGDQ